MDEIAQGMHVADPAAAELKVLAGCRMAPELSSIVSHLRSPRPLEVCSSLHEDWDCFMVPIDHSHGNNGSVFIVTAVGICSLQHMEKDKPATKPCTQEHLITFLDTNKHPRWN